MLAFYYWLLRRANPKESSAQERKEYPINRKLAKGFSPFCDRHQPKIKITLMGDTSMNQASLLYGGFEIAKEEENSLVCSEILDPHNNRSRSSTKNKHKR